MRRKGESVKAKVLLLSTWFGLLPVSASFGQSNYCAPLGGTTPNKLVCAFPASGSTLAQATFGLGTQAVTEATNAAIPINAAVAAQLTQLPVPSATIGTISITKKGSDVPVPFNNLGPILTDRPDTVGRGHVFLGFNYQHFNFNALDGFNLTNIPIAFTYNDSPGQTDLKTHYGSMANDVNFKLDQYVLIATGGLTRTLDVSVVFPINNISMKVVSSGFQAIDYDIATGTYSLHAPPTSASSITTTGSASGLGDVTIGLKQMLLGGGEQHTPAAAAIGAVFRLPSGDSYNYLGSGALGGSIYGLLEYRAKLAPHFKIAYIWNDESKILGLVNGGKAPLPGGLQYAIGSDFSLLSNLTINADILGSQFTNTPYFTSTTNAFFPPPSATELAAGVPANYTIVSTPSNTYTTANFSGGVKWAPIRHVPLLLYGNALIQINNVGLRADISPSFGIAYNFKLTH